MTTSINKKIAVGAGWLISLRWVDRLIHLFSIAILARLLQPADFGLVGYAMVFLAILDQLSMFSFETVLIRDQDATKDRYNTVWTLEVIKGLVLGIILIAGAKPVATFFNEPEVQNILYWIAIIPVLKGLINIGTVDFQKNLELHKDFFFKIATRFSGTISLLVFAIVLRNFWALVYGQIITSVLRVVLSYVMSDFRPRLTLSEFARTFGFSKWMLVQNICWGLNQRLPVIVIGKYFNAQALAFFNMAQELSSMASTEFAAPIRRALYPGITKMQKDLSQMTHTLKRTLGIIVLVGLPATIGISLTAPLLVPAFLGGNWVDAAPIVTVLSLLTATHLFYPNSHVIYYALNRPNITAYISIMRLCILAPTILFVGPRYGVIGTAWALVAISGVVIVVDYSILCRITKIRMSDVFAAVWRSAAAVMTMAAAVTYVLKYAAVSAITESMIVHLASCVIVGIVTYTSTLFFLWKLSDKPEGAESYILAALKNAAARKVIMRPKETT